MLGSLVLLPGCSKSTVATVSQVCEGWYPLYPSQYDRITDGTAEQMAANNAANKVWCGARPPFREPPPLEGKAIARPAAPVAPAAAPAKLAAKAG